MRLISTAIAAGLLLMAPQAGAATLITEAEAALPAAAGGVTLRGITRGPTVKLVNPAETKSPFDLKVKFEPHGGAAIEPGSIKVVYLKSPIVDITDRVKPFVSLTGIDMAKAEIPAGRHSIRIDVKDSEGRAGSTTVELTVTK
ncbi:hypothetical protein CCC_03730 [Paramagnetospirillum magnetotacticum MS-1]|uniref:Uncharacterized protein n=1 Tax=Paramagnetospirillum magnetotacticum MS-1 TaxID=272627 RepID=A0A0C2UAE0_PARME|nr:hypothetical protein [Paramagnetospirillum magnetotacticum]KIL98447.1 hypothetical protein CCC_03730 [Paramagnetospirillum magnetotacticum MS-1]